MENSIAAGKGGFGLSNNQLKIIAMLSMLADHMGMILFPEVRLLRIVGRLAFPIFAFMIAEGCAHTRNRGRYLLQRAAVALVCQIAYAVAMGSLFQCVMVSFLLASLSIFSLENFRTKRDPLSFAGAAAMALLVVGMTVIGPQLLRHRGFAVDYGFWGVMLPVVVYFLPGHLWKCAGAALMLALLCHTLEPRQWFSLLAIPLLMLYNGQRGKWKLKYLFYIFYPAHLGILYLISLL